MDAHLNATFAVTPAAIGPYALPPSSSSTTGWAFAVCNRLIVGLPFRVKLQYRPSLSRPSPRIINHSESSSTLCASASFDHLKQDCDAFLDVQDETVSRNQTLMSLTRLPLPPHSSFPSYNSPSYSGGWRGGGPISRLTKYV